MKSTLYTSLLIFLFYTVYFPVNGNTSIEDPDSLSVMEEANFSGFSENLDSLITLWYVSNSINQDTSLVAETYENDSLPPKFPDSVYIDRLSRIPNMIPLSFNRIVRNYINVYTRTKKEKLEVMLGLSQYYFPLIDEILDRYDLPYELKYMAVIESALNPRAVSRVGATGLWQFMYGTGRMYGLTINSLVDERRDPVKSTEAAAHYLKDLYRIYHDWILVIAAYNCGPGNVNKAIRRSGGKRNYWDIYYRLPRETRGYVPAYIAATYAMNYYKNHHLHPVPIEMPLATDTLIIEDNLHFKQVSAVLGLPLKELRDLNPQYRRDIVPGKSKPQAIRVPMSYTTAFIDLQDSIFGYKQKELLSTDKMITKPVYSHYSPPPPTGKTKLYYTVKSGDNLGFIAEWYHVRASDLRYWNGIRHNLIRTGQKLKVYVSPSRASRYRKINKMSFAEKQKSIGKTVPVAQGISSYIVPKDAKFEYYRVKNGDTVWEIARKFPGVTDQDILRLNNLSSFDKIHPGQEIRIKLKN